MRLLLVEDEDRLARVLTRALEEDGFSVDSCSNGVDAFVAKLDSTGAILWSHTFTGSGQQIVGGVATDGAGNAIGQAGTPKADQPGGDLRQIFRAHGEGAERVAEPARELAPHILGGERHDVGEGEGAGIASAGRTASKYVESKARVASIAGLARLGCMAESAGARTPCDH